MTTETIQNTSTTQKNRFLTNSRDLFSFLKKNQSNSEPRSQMNSLLKSAYVMLEKAEQELQEKEKRIHKLENLITTDELTALTNRRGFYSSFRAELDRTNRGENAGGLLIMIDLDDFKLINDTYGHRAGDEALKLLGTFLKDSIRDMDIAARIGGDEFIVLFPNTSIAQSMKRAKELGEQLNALSFKWDDNDINLQASLGLREYKQGDTINNIIEDADHGMYQEKELKKQTRH